MSGQPLRAALAEYLAVRRSLGFKLARDGLLLEQFAGFCEQARASRVTSELALAWVSAPAEASPGWLAMRLTIVRGFASWLQASDPATEVPPLGWLPPRRRTTPYLYSADDVAALLAAARRMRWPLSAATYETFIALLAVTGMRVGEAIRLDRSDLSPGDGLLTISDSKFGASRQLLLHPSTVSALGCYLRRRGELSPAPGEPALFVHPAGNRLTSRHGRYQDAIHYWGTTINLADAHRCAPDSAWMSYLKQPYVVASDIGGRYSQPYF